MSLIPWRTKRRERDLAENSLDVFRSELDHLFDRFLGNGSEFPWGGCGRGFDWGPAMDVSETDREITVQAEVPGMDPKDLEVTVSGGVLTISGEKKDVTERKGKNFHHTERRFGSFSRSVSLPTSADTESLSAEYKNGVLVVHIAKREEASPKRIAITAS